MKYRLTVQAFDPAMEMSMRTGYMPPVDHPLENRNRTLEVELTETEWLAVKRAVIETM